MSLLATKPLERLLEETGEREHALKRTFGPVSLVALGIGAITGAGIFSLTGTAAANNAVARRVIVRNRFPHRYSLRGGKALRFHRMA